MITRIVAALDGLAARLSAIICLLTIPHRETAAVMAVYQMWPQGGELLSDAVAQELERVLGENQELRRQALADRRRRGE